MNRLIILATLGASLMFTETGCGRTVEGKQQEKSALRFKMKSLGGKEVDLSKYKGKVVLIVNVASKCGFTPQYEQLQALYEKYAKKGLAILGFPCNQFLRQEPGTAEEIRQFCRVNYGVTFDMFAKIDVNGENAADLYRLLTSLETKPKGPGKISWNFEKFLLDRNGFVVGRFGSRTKPDDPELVALIERELAKERKSETTSNAEAKDVDLSGYQWKNRVMLVFVPSRKNAPYRAFRGAWDANAEGTVDRDLILIEIVEDGTSRVGDAPVTTASAKQLRDTFKVEPGKATFVLVGKDGTSKLRKPSVEIDEIFELIDAMPMRKREMAEKE